ncbi:MAG: NAD(P)/FAD-dependent oxidoreductase [Deltaproteobacteria bacterium]|jgi:mercuric reductase|nr:NAD(P)/FAD-dependent oxidoreductase [Deltaproteobacteria bacterium]
MMRFSPDLVIIGAGTTAFAAAKHASQQGARVLMIEQAKVGGTCINWGCVPSKTLIHKAELYHAARRGERYGLNLSAGLLSCPDLMNAKQKAVDRVRQHNYLELIHSDPHIELMPGHAQFVSAETLRVGPEEIDCNRFLIATGGIPRSLDIPGIHKTGFLNSYSALNLPCVPQSVVIIGGGVIALEMGQMFLRFGSQVTVLERGERPLAEFDSRLTALLCGQLAAEGLHQHFGVEIERVEKQDEGIRVVGKIHGREASFQAERIMLAVGTVAATQGLGLDCAGVEMTPHGFIAVDREMKTSAPTVWAAGDVTGPPLIAPAGELEGEVAVDNMLNGSGRQVDHHGTPMAVFIDPEIAMVGLNAQQAAQEGLEAIESFLDLSLVGKAHIVDQPQGGLLLWADRRTGAVLGAQALAPRAADMIHEVALAVRCNLTVGDLANLVHVYPTISDGWRLLARKCQRELTERNSV